MRKEYLLFLLLPISQILMFGEPYLNGNYSDLWGDLGVILSIAADLIILFVLIQGAKKEKLEKELEQTRYLKNLEQEKTDLLEKRHCEIYEMRRKFEADVQEIQQFVEANNKEAASKVLKSLEAELEKNSGVRYCRHAIVNAVMKEKAQRCEKLHFTMEVSLLIPEKIEIEALHMCSIFSNLLDNALEAVEELEEARRQIQVSAQMNANYLVIKVKNTSEKKHALRTRRKGRGYGTRILAELAKKYEGSYEAAYADGYYQATIVLKAV